MCIRDRAAIETFCKQNGMTIIGQVPHDETLMDAERDEKSPYDFAPHGAGVEAIRKIAAEIEVLDKSWIITLVFVLNFLCGRFYRWFPPSHLQAKSRTRGGLNTQPNL